MRVDLNELSEFFSKNEKNREYLQGFLVLSIALLAIKVIFSTRLKYNLITLSHVVKSKKLKGPYRYLGEGAFGGVYSCKYNGDTVALKLYHVNDFQAQSMLEQESLQLSRLNGTHPNVMGFYGRIKLSKGHLYSPSWMSSWIYSPFPSHGCEGLILEYAEHGDLRKLLLSSTLSLHRKVHIIRQVASGLVYIHGKNIIHQDLKPDNILIAGAERVAKIADFGIARCKSWRITFGGRTIISAEADFSPGGTMIYAAPEIINSFNKDANRCTSKSDIFSLGLLIWEVLTQALPQRSRSQILNGTFDLQASRYNLFGYRKVIEDCISSEAADRPSASQVLAKV